MPNRLKGVKAVITGGAGAIGMATAHAFLIEGASVFITDFNDAAVDGALTKLNSEGNKVSGYPADVTSHNGVVNMIEKAAECMDGITALINNAGTVSPGYLVDKSISDIDRVIDVNTKGVILCTQAAIPHLKNSKNASITNTSSQAGRRGWNQSGIYSASKAAVIGFSRSMAIELAPDIRVNSIAPGHVKDEGMAWRSFAIRKENHQSVEDFSSELAATEIPLRRLQSASDIANGFVFLTSLEASEITGAVLNIGGGVVMD
ncbi:MAG: oxidoreductase [Chloroflexi bacterium]|nr:oxidoreductase [Chloroflexota bacterium]|tara:strand:- start:264 stop:1046 length:783 start_codon:yes stop_codon:yes gene_type:complete